AASVFAYFAGENIDAIIIIIIVFINASIGFLQEFKAEKAIEALQKLLAPHARVIRDGKHISIPAGELVPGDLMVLSEGDKVSADCELFEENEILIDESILTGESMPVRKDTEKDNRLFMGTQIAAGTGKAIVTKTGMRTEFGKIAALTTETKKDKSPLQKELAHIGVFTGKITLGIALVLFLIGIFGRGQGIVETLLFAVAVAVAAVPEGLPTTITVALALGVQRLAKKNAIVKQLSSVETLGSTTVICSDKTGTLTKNEMTVQEMIIDEYDITAHGVGYEPRGGFSIHGYHSGSESEYLEYEKDSLHELAHKKPLLYEHFELMSRSAVLCNNAKLTEIEEQWKILGDPTEGALITLAEKAGFSVSGINQKHKRIHEFPFDSKRKRMSVIAQDEKTSALFSYVKGAPDSLLPLCTKIIKDGRVVSLDQKHLHEILKHNDALAAKALRIIAVAYKEMPKSPVGGKYIKESAESDLIFLGLVGMIDPPRDEVKEAVRLTHRAGIRVFIITGDHGLTAHAIAKQLGLVKTHGANIVTGEMLNEMSESKLLGFVAKGQETIFARVSPEHKLRIVNALKESGEVVAVTGDGVNDAPALKRADIGIAMGITGTDVSKEAANMILTDDSFSTIVTAVMEGRTIYENMKKFIYFIFSSNIGELLAVFSTILFGLPAPLTAVFLLIINTLTDVFPALALGVEPVERDILERPPRKPDSKIIQGAFLYRFLAAGIWKGLVTAAVFFGNLWVNGWRFGQDLNTDTYLYMQSATMAFVVLTLLQMVQAVNSRSLTVSVFRMKFFENLYLLAAIVFSTVATILIVQMPIFEKYLKTTALTLNQWLILTAAAMTILVFEEIRKAVFSRN
ncbi:MAG: cation-transporting P-type ATPase, partial [Patescibacteria group bacterium]